jgi:ribokinase
MPSLRRVAVVGHVEHIAIQRVEQLPSAGEIVHLDEPTFFPGGGGGVAFTQLCKSSAEVHFFTALGSGSTGEFCRRELQSIGVVHAIERDEAHCSAVVLITPGGERTIMVVGKAQQPRADDPLPWHLLDSCDAVYFTGTDPQTLALARKARTLVVTSRRRAVLNASQVKADGVVGSANDPREKASLADFALAPGVVVMTESSRGGTVETARGCTRFSAPQDVNIQGGAYGAGDSFAAALTWYLGSGFDFVPGCERAGLHGAAVLQGLDPRRHQLALK